MSDLGNVLRVPLRKMAHFKTAEFQLYWVKIIILKWWFSVSVFKELFCVFESSDLRDGKLCGLKIV